MTHAPTELKAARDIVEANIVSGDVDDDTALVNVAGLIADIAEFLPASEAGWRDVKAELPPLEQVVIIRYPSGYDGGDVFAWGARVDDGEGWLWGVKTGYDASVRPSEDASWNDVEVDDDYPVTHWMHLPSAPDRRPA